MIAVGNSKVSDDAIKIDANINQGHICYFKIAETPQAVEEGYYRSLSLLGMGGGNYADNVDGISYAYVCIHRGNIKASYDTITGAAYIDWYYRIVNGVVEIWVSPKSQYPNFISILVMRNAYGNWNVGNLEHSLDLPGGLVDF